MMIKSFNLLLLWHGLFAGSYTIAYLTSEGAEGLHRFAGYSALTLLAVRLLAATLAGDRGPWALPWVTVGAWRNFGRKLDREGFAAFKGRTPLVPLSALGVLAALVAVTLSGLTADQWDWGEFHEALAEGSLAVVFGHIAVVSFGPLLRRTGGDRGAARAPAPGR